MASYFTVYIPYTLCEAGAHALQRDHNKIIGVLGELIVQCRRILLFCLILCDWFHVASYMN